MYDISQLNDMLVPELLDIAEHFKIPLSKKQPEKQDLISKILDSQSANSKPSSADGGDEKRKRKRIVKSAAPVTVTAAPEVPEEQKEP